MIQHVYLSRATSLFHETELAELLRRARRKNEQLGVTGMLVYREPFFMQVLEGPETAIDDLLATIGADRRHTQLTTVLQTSIRHRAFGDWSMGFFRPEASKVSELVLQYPGYHDFFAADFEPRLFAANPSAAKKLLLAFRDECIRPGGITFPQAHVS